MALTPVDISDAGSLFHILVPFLICLCISFMLCGLGTAQTLYYLSRPGNDPSWIRWMVIVIWLVDLAHSVLTARAEIFYAVLSVNRLELLGRVDWSVTIILALQAVIVLIVQSFYVRRLWLLSDRSILVVFLPAALLPCRIAMAVFSYAALLSARTLTALKFNFQISKPMDQSPNRVPLQNSLHKLWDFADGIYRQLITEVSLVFGIVLDFSVTMPMLYYLRSSQTKFASTHGALRSLMVFSLNTGLLVMLISAAVMFTYIRLDNYLLFAGLYSIGGKLYVNSLLGTLSARKVIQEKMYECNVSNLRVDINTPRQSTTAHAHSMPTAHPLSSSFSSPGSHGTSETIRVNEPVSGV
ncbi:hypothetical protein K474DRAFT_1678389 [Panus rudis PR-1116 ss-1]|nr:hypothetical protein K474DRAFT_1678389 [Panus rudis PR-1116 ss-1]